MHTSKLNELIMIIITYECVLASSDVTLPCFANKTCWLLRRNKFRQASKNVTLLLTNTKKQELGFSGLWGFFPLNRTDQERLFFLFYLSYLLQPTVTAMCLKHSGSQRTDRHRGSRGIGALWEMSSLWLFPTHQAIFPHVSSSLKLPQREIFSISHDVRIIELQWQRRTTPSDSYWPERRSLELAIRTQICSC